MNSQAKPQEAAGQLIVPPYSDFERCLDDSLLAESIERRLVLSMQTSDFELQRIFRMALYRAEDYAMAWWLIWQANSEPMSYVRTGEWP